MKRRWRAMPGLLLVILGSLLLAACDWPGLPTTDTGLGPQATASPEAAAPGPLRIRFLSDDPTSVSLPLEQAAAADFARQTGIAVEVVPGPSSTTDRLSEYQLYLLAQSPDIDVYMIDVIWPGILAGDLLDLRPYIPPAQLDSYFPAGIANNTVGGKLIGLPYFVDVGTLYYRTDLLQKYGIAGPPQTWDELAADARTIQAGERAAGHTDFWGYVWQGDAYEGLTCDAVEWQASQGGGTILGADGAATVNNPAAIQALARARSWIGDISPPAVLTYQEEASRQVWQDGHAAFMRNWTYAWARGNTPDAQTGRLPVIAGKFDIAPLPRGDGPAAQHAGTLGGWQLAVSRYSTHPAEAARFVAFLASRAHEKERAIKVSALPAVRDLYADADVLAANPYYSRIAAVLAGAVTRPSTAAAEAYNQITSDYFTAVHHILTGEQPPATALPALQAQLQAVMAARSSR